MPHLIVCATARCDRSRERNELEAFPGVPRRQASNLLRWRKPEGSANNIIEDGVSGAGSQHELG